VRSPKKFVRTVAAVLLTAIGVTVVNIGSAQAVDRIQATSISVGGEATLGYGCAILLSEEVLCWGTQAPISGIVPGINSAISLASGFTHTCAALRNGNVKCWGQNSKGELGDSSTTNRNAPVTVVGIGGIGLLSDIVEVVASAKHQVTCARSSIGQVFCWGSRDNLLLGDSILTSFISTPVAVRERAADIPLANVASIAVGTYAACAVKVNGSTYCWGVGGHLELGSLEFMSSVKAVPVVGVGGIGLLNDATQISLGDAMGCVRRTTGEVACWGMNNLGTGTDAGSAFPVAVSGVSNAVQVSTDQENGCVVLTTGAVKCWGGWNGDEGPALSNKLVTGTLLPADIGSFTNAKSLSTGGGWPQKYCAILADATVRCWGSNNAGELGMDPDLLRYSNIPVEPQLSFIIGTVSTSSSSSTTSTTVPTTSPSSTIASTSTSSVPSALTVEIQAPTATVAKGQSAVERIDSKTPGLAVASSSTSVPSVAAVTTTTVTPQKESDVPPVVPAVAPGEGSFAVAGVSTKPVVTREANSLVLTAGAFSATLSGETADGEAITLDDDGNVHLESGDFVRVNVAGFTPGDSCDVWLFSTPVKLGTGRIGADGRLSEKFEIPKNIEKGSHRIVVRVGASPEDSASFTVGFTVGAVNPTSTLTRVLIGIPITLAIMFGLLLPNQLRRRRRGTAG
jgi:alpha-tubulin suppressor-like RCC1 family protein